MASFKLLMRMIEELIINQKYNISKIAQIAHIMAFLRGRSTLKYNVVNKWFQ